MLCKYAIYVCPKPVDDEPIGYVTADNMTVARRKVARFIKIGYELRLLPT
jgi:hypothetical protein